MTTISTVGNRVFVDTGAYYAFIDRDDRYHRKAAGVFEAIGNIRQVTTDLVVSECFSLVRYRLGLSQALSFLDKIYAARDKGFVSIAYHGPEHEREVRELLARFADQRLSYVDAFSLVLLNKKGAPKDVFTFDRHFYLAKCNIIPGDLR
ncbi:MAG: type II toxin-antitoxin system VapC family toxin [Peptococcaceae bacterium]|nr:type II toxin-antitoxin system VapC family toxin [Peptococcaceae bacterium]